MVTGKDEQVPDNFDEDRWVEIFDEVTLGKELPLLYIKALIIHFDDGRNWEIVIGRNNHKNKLEEFRRGLDEIFSSYQDQIMDVNVNINTTKIKRDVTKSVNRMLNKLKI